MRRSLDKSWYSAAEGLVPSAVLAHIVRYNLYNPMQAVDDAAGSTGGLNAPSPTVSVAASVPAGDSFAGS